MAPSSDWTIEAIEQVKKAVKSEVDSVTGKFSPKETLSFLQERIAESQIAPSDASFLECLIYVITTIIHNARHGGLTAGAEKKLVRRAYEILDSQEIDIEQSSLSVLYGYLHLATSQSARAQGQHWKSFWEQKLAFIMSKPNPPGSADFEYITSAFRAMRLGDLVSALRYFDDLNFDNVGSRDRTLAEIGRLKCNRLLGNRDYVFTNTDRLLSSIDSEPALLEIQWEKMCAEQAQGTRSLTDLVADTKKGGSHFQQAYYIEGFVWSASLANDEEMGKFPRLRRLDKTALFDVDTSNAFHRSAVALQEAYDEKIPYPIRLRQIGETLDRLNLLESFDKELMVLAAAARWLVRRKLDDLAAVVLADYRSRCLKATLQKNPDIIGSVGDLEPRPA